MPVPLDKISLGMTGFPQRLPAAAEHMLLDSIQRVKCRKFSLLVCHSITHHVCHEAVVIHTHTECIKRMKSVSVRILSHSTVTANHDALVVYSWFRHAL